MWIPLALAGFAGYLLLKGGKDSVPTSVSGDRLEQLAEGSSYKLLLVQTKGPSYPTIEDGWALAKSMAATFKADSVRTELGDMVIAGTAIKTTTVSYGTFQFSGREYKITAVVKQ